MTATYKIIRQGDCFKSHKLENTETGEVLELCSCGGTNNADGTCDGAHKRKRASGCECEFCTEKHPANVA